MNMKPQLYVALGSVALLVTSAARAQNSAIWTNLNGGSWNDALNWSNHFVPNAAGITADFSKETLTTAINVTLDSSPTVGHLVFGDPGNNYTTEIDPGTGGTLVLSATNTPSINVINQTGLVTCVMGTVNGLIKSGNGMLSLSASDVLGGGVTVNAGTNLFIPGGVFDAHNGSSLTINSGASVQFSGPANYDGIINGPLPITVNAGGMLRVTARSNMGYDYPANYANITLNGGTFEIDAEAQYINTITLNGGLVTGTPGSGVIAYWYAIPVGMNVISNATIATGVALNNNFVDNTVVSPGATLTIGYYQSGGSVTLTGGGTIIVTNNTSDQYPYTGLTTIQDGTFIVRGLLGSGPVIDSGILGGTGAIGGLVTVNSGGTVYVDSNVTSNAAVGSLSMTNGLLLNPGSTNFMRISKNGGVATNDTMIVGSLTYGGTLAVANITKDGHLLAAGDRFVLFPSAGSYTNGYNAFVLPSLGAGLGWNLTNLTVDGSIAVSTGASTPAFNPPPGGYYGAQLVTITSLTPGATIYYTTNGTTPTLGSPSGPSGVTVALPAGQITTIQAFAHASGYADSPVVSGVYDTTLPAPPAVISITAQPQGATVGAGDAVTFSVGAVLANGLASQLRYQWQRNSNNIAGATAPSYTTPPVAVTNSGDLYGCILSAPATSAAPVASAQATLVVGQANLIALWKFDEASTSQPAADSSGNGINATYSGGATLVPGKFGNAVKLNGTNALVTSQSSALLAPSTLSLDFWMNMDPSATIPMLPVSSEPGSPWAVQVTPTNSLLDWIVSSAANNTATNVITPGTWQNVAIVQGQSSARVFVNGALVNSGANAGLPGPYVEAGILIGRRGDGYFLNGSLANLAIFRTAISAAQVQSDMTNGVHAGEANLLALWNFNETSTNQPAADSSGHGLNGIYEGGVTPGSPGPMTNAATTKAALFDGTSGYVWVPPNPILDVADITIEFWVDCTDPNPGAYDMAITRDINNGQYNGNKPWVVSLSPDPMGGTTREVQWIVNGNNILAVTQALPPGGWHHVAITQTADHARLFVDGVLLSENFFSPSTLSDVLPPSVIVGGASGSFFKGLIDDLAVFQGPLSVAQINAYMSNGVPDATLSIQPSGKNVRLSWGDDLLGATLQASSTLTNNATTWTVVTGGTNSPVTLSTSNHSTFYRLQR